MIDRNNLLYAVRDGEWGGTPVPETGEDLFNLSSSFTRSNGTVSARLYERLTKKSRRRGGLSHAEAMYRKGVYDALTALQDELSA